MADIYSILLTGLNSLEENLTLSHFSRLGHRIVTAGGLVEAKDILKKQKIDLVYLQASTGDRILPDLREINEFSALPVVLLCPRSAEGLILDAWHAGAADIVLLPLTPQFLDSSLQRGAKQLPSRETERTAPVHARLFYLDDMGGECWANVTSPRFSIGRSSVNDLVLNQMGISRFHAEVLVQDGEYLVHDLGSKLGTLLNGVKVEQAKLTGGDRIQLGGPQGLSLVFHEGDLLQSLLGTTNSKSEISLSVHGFKEIGMLLAALRALSSIPLLDDLLALVVDTAIELTGAERGFIMLKEENSNLSFRCARNNQKRPLDGSDFQTSHRVPHEVFETGRPIVIKDLDYGDRFESHNSTRQLGLRSISCVPLRYMAVHEASDLSTFGRTETIGVLYVDSKSIGAGLSSSRMGALETLASEAAIAIYNARLYKDSQDKRKMDEQLAIAREIQQALLPQPVRDLSFVRAHSQNLPCNEVGGDYFDYFSLEGERFGFALGDVAGKGMSAALLASLIQGILSGQALFDIPLPAMISNVNQNLAKRGTGNRFVTFFFGILDPDGNCTYVNAGHNPPFLVRRDGSLEELTTGGMVLGLFPGAQYESDTIKLQPDDHLVLFTDGVVEALNTAGEEFGKERLEALLHANARVTTPEILDRLQEAVLTFSAKAPQHDDITLMILGYRESQI
jgi:serine phosphatase RsbU (regulator of sigma subunit)/pSer/pThr/pTyr-binding forkhead associated (FHA) protein